MKRVYLESIKEDFFKHQTFTKIQREIIWQNVNNNVDLLTEDQYKNMVFSLKKLKSLSSIDYSMALNSLEEFNGPKILADKNNQELNFSNFWKKKLYKEKNSIAINTAYTTALISAPFVGILSSVIIPILIPHMQLLYEQYSTIYTLNNDNLQKLLDLSNSKEDKDKNELYKFLSKDIDGALTYNSLNEKNREKYLNNIIKMYLTMDRYSKSMLKDASFEHLVIYSEKVLNELNGCAEHINDTRKTNISKFTLDDLILEKKSGLDLLKERVFKSNDNNSNKELEDIKKEASKIFSYTLIHFLAEDINFKKNISANIIDNEKRVNEYYEKGISQAWNKFNKSFSNISKDLISSNFSTINSLALEFDPIKNTNNYIVELLDTNAGQEVTKGLNATINKLNAINTMLTNGEDLTWMENADVKQVLVKKAASLIDDSSYAVALKELLQSVSADELKELQTHLLTNKSNWEADQINSFFDNYIPNAEGFIKNKLEKIIEKTTDNTFVLSNNRLNKKHTTINLLENELEVSKQIKENLNNSYPLTFSEKIKNKLIDFKISIQETELKVIKELEYTNNTDKVISFLSKSSRNIQKGLTIGSSLIKIPVIFAAKIVPEQTIKTINFFNKTDFKIKTFEEKFNYDYEVDQHFKSQTSKSVLANQIDIADNVDCVNLMLKLNAIREENKQSRKETITRNHLK